MSRNSISHYGETIYMTFTEQGNILRNKLHKINITFAFAIITGLIMLVYAHHS